MSTLVYGGLALTIAARWRQVAMPTLAAGLCLIAAIAVSRITTGAHNAAEVAVGLVVGAAALAIFARALLRDPLALPAKSMLACAALIIVLLHGQQVQAEGLFHAIGAYLQAQRALVCF